MNYELQKLLFVEAYKIIDLYVFVRICMSIDRRIRNVNTIMFKSRESSSANAETIDKEDFSFVRSFIASSRDISAISSAEFSRFETSARISHSNPVIEKMKREDKCFNCDVFDHLARNCTESKQKRISEMTFKNESNVSSSENDSKKE
jgi:hypothetical protein